MTRATPWQAGDSVVSLELREPGYVLVPKDELVGLRVASRRRLRALASYARAMALAFPTPVQIRSFAALIESEAEAYGPPEIQTSETPPIG